MESNKDGTAKPFDATHGSATDCRCEEYRVALERIAVFYRGGERATESMLEMRAIAKRALASPNNKVSDGGPVTPGFK